MPSSLETYRMFGEYLRTGRYDRFAEVIDAENYVENCVSMTGWTIGLDVALANFTNGFGRALSELSLDEQDVLETEDSVVIRARMGGTHTGTFLGVEPTGRRVTFDAVDWYRVGPDGRIVWRFLLCDWNAVRLQLLGEQPDLPQTPTRVAVQARGRETVEGGRADG
jgi:predicted ester cyclase